MSIEQVPFVPRHVYTGLSTDTKPEGATEWSILLEVDTGVRFRMYNGKWIVDPVSPATQSGGQSVVVRPVSGILVLGEQDNLLSGTPVRINAPSNILSFYARLSTRGTVTATELRIVFGATNDTDADAKLAGNGTKHILEIDMPGEYSFDSVQAVRRVDIASDAATEAGTKLIYEYVLEG